MYVVTRGSGFQCNTQSLQASSSHALNLHAISLVITLSALSRTQILTTSLGPTLDILATIIQMTDKAIMIPQNDCKPFHPWSRIAPAIGFPMRTPIAAGINNIPKRAPNNLGSGVSAETTAGPSETKAPEKKPKSRQKTTIPPVSTVLIQRKANTEANSVHTVTVFKGPYLSAI